MLYVNQWTILNKLYYELFFFIDMTSHKNRESNYIYVVYIHYSEDCVWFKRQIYLQKSIELVGASKKMDVCMVEEEYA